MTLKLYSIDVPVYATAYVKADSEEEAYALLVGMEDQAIEVNDDPYAVLLEDADAPDVTISPAMTCGRVSADPFIDIAYDPEEEES